METQQCTNCHVENEIGFRFCKACGAPLVTAELSGSSSGPSDDSAPPISPTDQKVGASAQAVGQMGAAGLSSLNIWGPFAGYGERGRHVSWLLNNLGDRSEALRDAVTERFNEREIPGARVRPLTLTGKGVAVERRPYYLAQRGIATAALYIARFGHDLYISQVTYARGAISPLRAIIVLLMLLFQVIYVPAIIASVAPIDFFGNLDILQMYGLRDYNFAGLGALICCVGPFWFFNGLALFLLALHMFYKFLTIKDPLSMLRLPPNEFQQDDIIALEKAVEETVRQSLDTIGIDASLMPPAAEYGFRRRLL